MEWFDAGIVMCVCVIDIFLLYDYFNNFFEVKVKKKYVKFISIIMCILLFGINILGNVNINLLLVVIVLWGFVSILFDCKFGVRLGYFVSAYVVMIGVEFFYAILSQTTLGMVEKNGWNTCVRVWLGSIVY